MAGPKKQAKLPGKLTLLFPNGTAQFIAAVMCMTLSLAILGAGVGDVFLSSAATDTKIIFQMISVVIVTFLIVHPTFMLTRGKRWARHFLRWLNLACVIGLALVTLRSAFYSSAVGYISVFGLALALVAFKIYRSRGFLNAATHFERVWNLHNDKKNSFATGKSRMHKS